MIHLFILLDIIIRGTAAEKPLIASLSARTIVSTRFAEFDPDPVFSGRDLRPRTLIGVW